MAIVVYKCDTCKREKEFARNVNGLDTLQNCTITHGCRGKLYHKQLLPDYIRGSIPEDVTGLDDWLQRKALYNHIQGIERLEWNITHNLGTFPSIQVFVNRPIEGDEDNQEELLPTDINIIDKNAVRLTFDRPWSGIAQLVTRQSDPNLLNPIITEPETTGIQYTQISNGGEFSIATKIATLGASSNINLSLLYTTTQGSNPSIVYAADDQPSLLSAWRDFDIVVINGNIYTVRSFNAITAELTSGVIGNGSTFVVNTIDPTGTQAFQDINESDVILLLADDPYSPFDKNIDRYVDVTNRSSDTTSFDFLYDSGEFFVNDAIIQSIYPHIRSTQ